MDKQIILAAALIHQYTNDRKTSMVHISELLDFDNVTEHKFKGQLYTIGDEDIQLNRMYSLSSLKAISKIENRDGLFLFLDGMIDQLRGHHTVEIISKLFDRNDLRQAILNTRHNWQQVLMENRT